MTKDTRTKLHTVKLLNVKSSVDAEDQDFYNFYLLECTYSDVYLCKTFSTVRGHLTHLRYPVVPVVPLRKTTGIGQS